jgi:hypothetical protein
MYRTVIFTGLLAVAISTGVATADADNFANSVRQNNLGSVTDPDVQDSRFRAFMEELQNVIAIEKDNRVINRQRRQQNWDRLEQGNAQNQLESNFR